MSIPSRRRFIRLILGAPLGSLACRSSLLRGLTPSVMGKIRTQPFGIAYGPYRQHESPDGLQPTEDEIREDLRLLRTILPKPRRIRVYSSTGPGGLAAIIAPEEGFLVTLGAWIGNESLQHDQNVKEVSELIRLASFVHPEMVIVGNETLLRSDATADQLKSYIQQVKSALPTIPVSAAEPWATWVVDPRGKDLVDAVDLLTVHVHPFWEQTPVSEAPQAVFQRLGEVRGKFGKPVVLGETGWPSDGVAQGDAVPSQENQRTFISEVMRLYKQQDARMFLFEAFDEPFKGVAMRGQNDVAAEGSTGANWGVFLWNRTMKPWLQDFFPKPPDPDPRSLLFRVLTRGSLAPGFDIGLDTALGQRNWMSQLTPDDAQRADGLPAFRLDYPANQCSGSFFITTRKPTSVIQERSVTNLSEYRQMAIDLRLMGGDDGVEIAPKTAEWPDDGTESKVVASGLTKQWQTAVIPLSYFSPTNPGSLYVVCGLDFFGMTAKSLDVAEIRFLPSGIDGGPSVPIAPLLVRSNLDPSILRGGQVSCGYGLGVATAAPLATDWVQAQQDFLRLSYPGGRDWGSTFFTVGNPVPQGGRKLSTDASGRNRLALEVRGENGGEVCAAGVRSVTTGPFELSLALTQFQLSPDWTWILVSLDSLSHADLSHLHVVASIEFTGSNSRTVYVRNIRLLSPGESPGQSSTLALSNARLLGRWLFTDPNL